MSKSTVPLLVFSILVNSCVSSAIILSIEHFSSRQPAVMRVGSIEIIDSKGRLRGSFGMQSSPFLGTHQVPEFTLMDESGRQVVRMTTDPKGRATLGFASDRWNEGAVMLGYLPPTDDVVFAQDSDELHQDSSGWGLSVKGLSFDATSIGYTRSGKLISPSCDLPTNASTPQVKK